MPNDTLKTLTAKLKELVGDSQEYQMFIEAVANADAKMTALHRPDRFGRIPRMTREDRDLLMQLHKEIGMKAERVFQSEADKTRKELVKKITALAAGNHRALLTYEPEREPKSLPSLLSEVRTLTLDTRGASLKTKVGAAASSRQPITFLDDKGREFTGVFTPKREMHVRRTLQAKLDRIAEGVRDPAAKELVTRFIDNYIASQAADPDNKVNSWPEERKIAALNGFLEMIAADDPAIPDKTKLKREFDDLYRGKPGYDRLSTSVKMAIGRAVCESAVDLNVNLAQGKLPDGARIDTRNAAMSAVADLLGVPNLLARSRPMKLILADGSEVEGTFTQEAKGLDPENLDERAASIDISALSRKTPEDRQNVGKALKSLADLQILDYLCGNVDRHQSNMLYQFNLNNKFSSVQGIDNDCSLGILEPDRYQREKEIPPLSEMKVISESMKNVIENLTPETLRFTLRGFGLSERELDAAKYRLNMLKRQLQEDKEYFEERERNPELNDQEKFPNGHIRVMKDDDWQHVKMSELELVQRYADIEGNWISEPNNVFASAKLVIQDMKGDYRKQTKAYQSLRSEVAIGSGNRSIPTEQAKEAERARKLGVLLMKRTTQGRSSRQYDEMQEAVEDYAHFQLEVRKRIEAAQKDNEDPEAVYDRIVTTADLKKMRQLAEAVRVKADAYLEHKGGGLHIGYTARRIEAAKMARELGQKGVVISKMEEQTAERSMRGAIEEVQRRVGDKLEAKEQSRNGPNAQNAGLGAAAHT